MTLRETEADKKTEKEYLDYVCEKWGCSIRNFGPQSPIDWSLHRGESLIGFAEFKARGRELNSFDTVFLNLNKYLSLQYASSAFGVKSVFIIGCSDGVYYIDIAQVDPRQVLVKGRSDRGTAADVQPVIEIPSTQFRKIG